MTQKVQHNVNGSADNAFEIKTVGLHLRPQNLCHWYSNTNGIPD